jgi:hypothetical protein
MFYIISLERKFLILNCFLNIHRHYFIWWFRMLGLKIGNSCLLSRHNFGIEEIELLEVGNGVFIGATPLFHFKVKLPNGK